MVFTIGHPGILFVLVVWWVQSFVVGVLVLDLDVLSGCTVFRRGFHHTFGTLKLKHMDDDAEHLSQMSNSASPPSLWLNDGMPKMWRKPHWSTVPKSSRSGTGASTPKNCTCHPTSEKRIPGWSTLKTSSQWWKVGIKIIHWELIYDGYDELYQNRLTLAQDVETTLKS